MKKYIVFTLIVFTTSSLNYGRSTEYAHLDLLDRIATAQETNVLRQSVKDCYDIGAYSENTENIPEDFCRACQKVKRLFGLYLDSIVALQEAENFSKR